MTDDPTCLIEAASLAIEAAASRPPRDASYVYGIRVESAMIDGAIRPIRPEDDVRIEVQPAFGPVPDQVTVTYETCAPVYVLVCHGCNDAILPFPSPEERGRWAGEHRRGMGHDRWTVLDLPRDHVGDTIDGQIVSTEVEQC